MDKNLKSEKQKDRPLLVKSDKNKRDAGKGIDSMNSVSDQPKENQFVKPHMLFK
jgi:hypothetical protein